MRHPGIHSYTNTLIHVYTYAREHSYTIPLHLYGCTAFDNSPFCASLISAQPVALLVTTSEEEAYRVTYERIGLIEPPREDLQRSCDLCRSHVTYADVM